MHRLKPFLAGLAAAILFGFFFYAVMPRLMLAVASAAVGTMVYKALRWPRG